MSLVHTVLTPPAEVMLFSVPGAYVAAFVSVFAVATFTYFVCVRMRPLLRAAPDNRIDKLCARLLQLTRMGLLQWRHPRYKVAGYIHIAMFYCFLVLLMRSTEMVVIGIEPGFTILDNSSWLGVLYKNIRSYATTCLVLVAVVAMVRRGIVRPARYAVPTEFKSRTREAMLVLGMILALVVSDSLFEGSLVAAQIQIGGPVDSIAPLSLAWVLSRVLDTTDPSILQSLHTAAYFIHDLAFFSFLCLLPLGKHFHVATSLFNLFFMRLQQGNVKPIRHGLLEDEIEDLESFGVKTLEDFTWKHILDFYSCADCGRCSDNCPATTVGRPLSPRLLTIKARDLAYKSYPLFPLGATPKKSEPLIGTIYEEDEIWSCTTCGACEQECPLGIEYIDKIVDLRRGMVDDGMVPQSLQKPLRSIEKRGNPWGKPQKDRGVWAQESGNDIDVNILDGDKTAETLYFVDSITSYDSRMQNIAKATAKVLNHTGVDFGILGANEKDSGHDVRRFGEEMLFNDLRDHNQDEIERSGIKHIVTADPHAFNALKNDYPEGAQIEHISQLMGRQIAAGELVFKEVQDREKVYTFHDPCYLGRHNGVYEDPRHVIDAIPQINRVEMQRCKDRSFCCGGGGMALFYEAKEEQRMGVIRVQMAHEAGANAIVTACPNCMANLEDAIKVSGLEGKMQAIDLVELAADHLA